MKKVRSGYGEDVISTKKSPTNAPPSHSDTSSLALVVSALPSARSPPGGAGQGGSRCENQKVTNVHGFWKHQSESLLWEMGGTS